MCVNLRLTPDLKRSSPHSLLPFSPRLSDMLPAKTEPVVIENCDLDIPESGRLSGRSSHVDDHMVTDDYSDWGDYEEMLFPVDFPPEDFPEDERYSPVPDYIEYDAKNKQPSVMMEDGGDDTTVELELPPPLEVRRGHHHRTRPGGGRREPGRWELG